MGTHAQTLLDILAAPAALLRREARGHSHQHVTSSRSLVRENIEERAPTRVVDALGEVMVPHHPPHVEGFHADATVLLRAVLGDVEMAVPALARDLEVLARDFTRSFAAAVATFLAATQRTLRVGPSLLPLAIVARRSTTALPRRPQSPPETLSAPSPTR